MKALQSALVSCALLSVVGCGDGGTNGTVDALSTTSLDPATCAAGATPIVLSPVAITVWPPNHKFHSFSVSDCVNIATCDPNVSAEFLWASSDEPVDSIGDGHTGPDIIFDGCQDVQLRAERQGPSDGRVYKLGVRVSDAAGHVAMGECSVIVDHDQRGTLGSDSGENYRVIPMQANGLACDAPAPPAPADAGLPPVVVKPAPDASVAPAPDASANPILFGI